MDGTMPLDSFHALVFLEIRRKHNGTKIVTAILCNPFDRGWTIRLFPGQRYNSYTTDATQKEILTTTDKLADTLHTNAAYSSRASCFQNSSKKLLSSKETRLEKLSRSANRWK